MTTDNPLSDCRPRPLCMAAWVPGFGEEGQQNCAMLRVLISRVGGLGSPVAYELAAAGVGRLVLAHAGNLKPSDLNRQLLMSHSRLEQAALKRPPSG